MNEQLRLDQAGIDFIIEQEGCILHPYNDPLNATIGVGHLIHLGRVTQADIDRYKGFTRANAESLLREDVRAAEAAIRGHIHTVIEQNQWNALVDLVFNCGPGVLDGDIGQLINRRHFAEAAQAWEAWDHNGLGEVIPDLQRRRELERAMFLTPEPAYWPADEKRWETEYDQLKGKRTPRATVRRRALVRAMKARILEILKLVHTEPDGWNKLNRKARYYALLRRV